MHLCAENQEWCAVYEQCVAPVLVNDAGSGWGAAWRGSHEWEGGRQQRSGRDPACDLQGVDGLFMLILSPRGVISHSGAFGIMLRNVRIATH